MPLSIASSLTPRALAWAFSAFLDTLVRTDPGATRELSLLDAPSVPVSCRDSRSDRAWRRYRRSVRARRRYPQHWILRHMFSAVHPTTDIAKILRHVRFVPQPDSCTAAFSASKSFLLSEQMQFLYI